MVVVFSLFAVLLGGVDAGGLQMNDARPVTGTLLEQTISSETVFSGVFLNAVREKVVAPDGREFIREFIRHPGAVVVIPILNSGRLLLERQYRHPLGKIFIEFPAGKLDSGEDALSCGKRELEEETGYRASDWRHLGVMHPCIGYSDERIEIFSASGLSYVGHKWDDGEFLEFVEMDPVAAYKAVIDGHITDAKTIAALFWVQQVFGVC